MNKKSSSSLLKLECYDHGEKPSGKICEWPDCPEEAAHKAPRSRTAMNSYRWFCREHARGYNKNWNYFSGMTDYEVEADRRADTVWQRPSWPLGNHVASLESVHAYLRDDFSFPFSDFGNKYYNSWPGSGSNKIVLDSELKDAFTIFNINLPVSTDDVKTRYKALVKRHHPDAAKHNADEERLKDINHAYQAILAFLEP